MLRTMADVQGKRKGKKGVWRKWHHLVKRLNNFLTCSIRACQRGVSVDSELFPILIGFGGGGGGGGGGKADGAKETHLRSSKFL